MRSYNHTSYEYKPLFYVVLALFVIMVIGIIILIWLGTSGQLGFTSEQNRENFNQ